MEKSKFEEAKKQAEIIKACEQVLLEYDCGAVISIESVTNVVFADKMITRSFIRWVSNEKEIAEKKFKEI